MKIDGLPVRDATEALAFTVKPRDITKNGIKSPDSCAMAMACRREHHARDVRIHMKYSYVLEKDHWLRYRTPPSVTREIIAFDRGGAFDPGEYMLLPPYKSARLLRKPLRLGTAKRMSYRKKTFVHIIANVRSRPVLAARVLDERA